MWSPCQGLSAKVWRQTHAHRILHELAIRFLTGVTANLAAKHDIGINVLFSHSSDHYIRVYTQIFYGAKKADDSIKNIGYILHCFNCFHRETAKKPFDKNMVCPECGSKIDYAGPCGLGAFLMLILLI
jgi:tRNA (guanine26-N2/guanine27-N2)-dimethyltransferase